MKTKYWYSTTYIAYISSTITLWGNSIQVYLDTLSTTPREQVYAFRKEPSRSSRGHSIPPPPGRVGGDGGARAFTAGEHCVTVCHSSGGELAGRPVSPPGQRFALRNFHPAANRSSTFDTRGANSRRCTLLDPKQMSPLSNGTPINPNSQNTAHLPFLFVTFPYLSP